MISKHQADLFMKEARRWKLVAKLIADYLQKQLAHEPLICRNTLGRIALGNFSIRFEAGDEHVDLYIADDVKNDTYRIDDKTTKAITWVEVDAYITWGSTQRNTSRAATAILLYQKALDLANLVKTAFPAEYGIALTDE